eukprot:TRINITY_DN46_c0_g1_i1.p1 TRINITY_DN46_c0_g1~~TRINITY_DN46_c0_g1_i1.p1  ORF type:complete len:213 (+),score=76.83 TRINITY_DN46_c0_g1_i1:50-688(+)
MQAVKKVFIGNLPENPTEQEVLTLVSQFGATRDIFVHKNKRFAVVQFKNDEAASFAIFKLNGTNYCNGTLNVRFEKERQEKSNKKDEAPQPEAEEEVAAVEPVVKDPNSTPLGGEMIAPARTGRRRRRRKKNNNKNTPVTKEIYHPPAEEKPVVAKPVAPVEPEEPETNVHVIVVDANTGNEIIVGSVQGDRASIKNRNIFQQFVLPLVDQL